MANALPIVLLGAAFLLLRKKGGDGASTANTGEAEQTAEEHEPAWQEGDPIPEDWEPAPILEDGVQRYFKPVKEMQIAGFTPADWLDEANQNQPSPPPPDPGVEPPEPDMDVPPGAYCSDVANWDPQWAALEEAMLVKINELRAQGYSNCHEGPQSPAPPLTMNPHLRCSARKHSKDMAINNYFSHTNLEGEESWDRMWAAGFDGLKASENITAGPPTVEQAMQNFLQSTAGHCEALFDPGMTDVGIGYYQQGTGYQFYWTQNFGG